MNTRIINNAKDANVETYTTIDTDTIGQKTLTNSPMPEKKPVDEDINSGDNANLDKPQAGFNSSLDLLMSASNDTGTEVIFGAVPSFGASLMALIVDFAADLRRHTAETRAYETQAVIEQLQNQAEELKTKAITQITMGIVSGAVSVGQGLSSMHAVGSSLKKENVSASAAKATESAPAATSKTTQASEPQTAKATQVERTQASDAKAEVKAKQADDAATTAEEKLDETKIAEQKTAEADDAKAELQQTVDEQATKINEAEVLKIQKEHSQALTAYVKSQGYSCFFSAANSIVGGLNTGITDVADQKIKQYDAIIEGLRNMADTNKSLEDSLRELIQKSISTQQAMADNMNQTRSKILG